MMLCPCTGHMRPEKSPESAVVKPRFVQASEAVMSKAAGKVYTEPKREAMKDIISKVTGSQQYKPTRAQTSPPHASDAGHGAMQG